MINRLQRDVAAEVAAQSNYRRQQLVLGDFVFSSYLGCAYERMQRKTSGGWIDVDRVTGKPLSQQTGAGPEERRLTGKVYGWAGLDRLNIVRQLQATGQPHGLTDGQGNNLGRWRIMDVDTEEEKVIDDGTPMVTRFTIELKEFVDVADNQQGG